MANLRYVEISNRNPVTRILVGQGNSCNPYAICGDVCITIERAGSKNCKPKPQYDDCGQACYSAPQCAPVAVVCALEVDDNGYAVFQWPRELMAMQEGWYTGTVMNGCSKCGEFPVRIGPRCNVIKVETEIMGPDNACWVTCDDETCSSPICPTPSNKPINVYTPAYSTAAPTEGNTNGTGLFGQFLSKPN
jgi:hypothetical protein